MLRSFSKVTREAVIHLLAQFLWNGADRQKKVRIVHNKGDSRLKRGGGGAGGGGGEEEELEELPGQLNWLA